MKISHRQSRTDLVIDLDRDTHGTRIGYCLVSCLTLVAVNVIAAAFANSYHADDHYLMAVQGFVFIVFSAVSVDCFMRATKGSILKRGFRVMAVNAAAFIGGFMAYDAGVISDLQWQSVGFTSFVLCLWLFELHRSLNPDN